MLPLLIFLFGLLFGRLLNFCICRITGERQVTQLSSSCRKYKSSILPKYPIIELITASLFLIMYLKVGFLLQLVNYFLLLSILIVVTFIDLEHYIIPNKVLAYGGVLQLVANFYTHQIPYIDAIAGFFTGGIILLLIAVVSKGGMGGGDIKLAAVLGFFLGWQRVIIVFWVAAVLAAMTGITLIAIKRINRKDVIPFGPFLAVGTVACLLWSQLPLAWGLGLFLQPSK